LKEVSKIVFEPFVLASLRRKTLARLWRLLTNGHFPRLYTIHSQKGGVGKTSIAIAIAGIAAIIHNKKTLIIDADMTGVSLYDIFGLSDKKKPRYLNEILIAPPRRYEAILNKRRDNDKYIDNLNAYFHAVQQCEKIQYIPASPCISDIMCIVPLISQEDFHRFFRYRLEDIITTAIESNQFEVIIIDNSPGIFGISKSTMAIAINKVESQTIIVTSTDPTDYLALFPSLSNIVNSLGKKEDQFVYILNKIIKSEGQRDEAFIYRQLLNDLSNKNFADNRILDRKLYKKFIDDIRTNLTKTGGLAAPLVEGFSIHNILPTIKNIESTGNASGNYGQWCQEIRKSCNL